MSTNNKPDFALFFIKKTGKQNDAGRDKGFWVRIGSGWSAANGRVNIVQDFLPTCEGTMQLVPESELAKQ